MAPAPQGEDKDKPVEHPDDDHFNRLDPPDVVINADSSDSEEDEAFGGYMGYQMLAQDVPDNVESDNEKSVSINTVKPALSGHSKKDKTKILMTNGSLMKVKSIAECSPWSILQCF